MKTCHQCQSPFQVTDADRQFYQKLDVPEPKNCPKCRLMRRLQERNARKLYFRTCDFSGKKIISTYHEKQPYPVYHYEAWWSDEWDPMDYGQDFDFKRPFFEQFLELKNKVPRASVFVIASTLENSDFTNCTGYIKNCYLICESDYDEDCYYSNRVYHCKNVVDCTNMHESENCYQCIDCRTANNLQYSQDCQNCSDSFFLKNCNSCRNCIGCINVRQGEYMIFNQQYSKEEFEKKKANMKLDTYEGIQNLKKQVEEFFLTQPHKAVQGEMNQNVTGDHVHNSKNAELCFDSKDLEDCKYCVKVAGGVKDCMDYNSWGFKAELIYQSSSCGDDVYNLKFCSTCTTNNSDLEYCFNCTSTSNSFGCVGLKQKKFCILNKQYSEEGFYKMRERIIAYMKETGEWGEFFPIEICDYGYNETIAMDAFPLTRKEALASGYKWSDYETPAPQVEKIITASQLPNSNDEIPDDILNWAIECEKSGTLFNLTASELKFYRSMKIPIPRRHYDVRHQNRMEKRPPYELFERECDKCGNGIQSSYSPDSAEMVYCGQCYLEAVY